MKTQAGKHTNRFYNQLWQQVALPVVAVAHSTFYGRYRYSMYICAVSEDLPLWKLVRLVYPRHRLTNSLSSAWPTDRQSARKMRVYNGNSQLPAHTICMQHAIPCRMLFLVHSKKVFPQLCSVECESISVEWFRLSTLREYSRFAAKCATP